MPHLMLKDLPRYECLLEAAREFPELVPSAAEAYLHLLRTADDVFALSESRLAAHGISQGRFGVLMLLWRSSEPRTGDVPITQPPCGPRTPAELADAAGVTRATMTGLIDTLERDGYVVREPDPSDRRMLFVRLTRKAENFLTKFLPIHFRGASEVMGALTESERKTLVRLLGKIQQQVSPRSDVPAQKTA
ncbi:MAG: MarR family transcriptional regulator [Opitutae bacterium]|nr:MarR family transcriptional regulator [Opitutae bacterium]